MVAWCLSRVSTASVLLLLLCPVVSPAATHYAAPGGSSTASCAQAQPCSLNRGVSLLAAGDTLVLRGGTYTPGALGQHGTGTLASGTSWAHPVTIAAAPGETVWLAGPKAGIALAGSEAYLIFQGLRINASQGGGMFLGADAHHIRFQGGELCCATDRSPAGQNLITGIGSHFELLDSLLRDVAYGYPLYWSGRDSLFQGNTVTGSESYGFHIYGSGSNSVSNNIVRGNTFRQNGFSDPRGYLGCAVIISTGSGNQVLQNTLEGNGCGVQVDYRCLGCTVAFNTITQHRGTGISIGASAVGTRVCGNTLAGNRPDLDDAGQQTQWSGCPDPGGLPPPRPRLPAPWNLRLAPAR